MSVDLIPPADALEQGEALLRGELGPPDRCPVMVVQARPGPAYRRLAARADAFPCVVVVVGDPEVVPAAGDVALTQAPDPRSPWVSTLPATLEDLVTAIRGMPAAAVTLVQLLRLSGRLPVGDGLVAESLAYGLLQAGPEHQGWLARRPPRPQRAAPGEVVSVERRSDTLEIVLRQPQIRNAYGAAMRDALVQALETAVADSSIERVHLRGDGPAFCSGGNLDEFGTVADPVTGHLIRSVRSAGRLIDALRDRVTVDVHGACVGAGVELPAFAGRVVADPGARFCLPELGMGLVPGAGGTVSISRRIGRRRACWMAISGTPVEAATALAWGLIDEVAGAGPVRPSSV